MSVVSSTINIVVQYEAAKLALEAIKELGDMMIETTVKADKLNSMMTVAAGGATNAASEMQYLQGVSNKLGLEFQSTAEQFAKFQIAASTANVTLDDQKSIFENITGAMSKMGASADDTKGAMLAIEQMFSKGKVSAEELRGQLGERLPGAFELMAKALNVSTAELNKMMQAGEVGTDAIKKLADTIGEKYGVGGPVDTAQANINRLSNTWETTKRELVDSAWVNSAIKNLNTFAESVQHAAESIGILRKSHMDQMQQNLADYEKWEASAAKFGKTEDAAYWHEKAQNAKTYFTAVKQAEEETQAANKGTKPNTPQMSNQTESIIKSQMTAQEKLSAQQKTLTEDYNKGAISLDQYTTALNRAKDKELETLAAEQRRTDAAAKRAAAPGVAAAKKAEQEANQVFEYKKQLENKVENLEAQTTNNQIMQINLRAKAETDAATRAHSDFVRQHGVDSGEFELFQKQLTNIQQKAEADRLKLQETNEKAASDMITKNQDKALQIRISYQQKDKAYYAQRFSEELQMQDNKDRQEIAAFKGNEEQKTELLKSQMAIRTALQEKEAQQEIARETQKYELMGTLVKDFSSGVVSAFNDTSLSASQAMAQMAQNIIKKIEEMVLEYLILIAVQELAGMAGYSGIANAAGSMASKTSIGQLGSAMGKTQADGGAWSGGVQMFAQGGVVSSPTSFGMANGGTGVMGEAGPEAIMPLKRMSDGSLGVQTAQGSSGSKSDNSVNVGSIVVNVQQNQEQTSQEQADTIAKAMRTQMQALIDSRIQTATRPGNLLNPTQHNNVFG